MVQLRFFDSSFQCETFASSFDSGMLHGLEIFSFVPKFNSKSLRKSSFIRNLSEAINSPGCGKRSPRCSGSHVGLHIHGFPVSMNDPRPNLCRRLSLLCQLVGENRFSLADVALRTMFARVTIKQALMSGVPVAVAVAGLLVKDRLDFCRQRINIAIKRI